MRDFKDFGFVYQATDGKKRFDCITMSLGDLQNTTIIVKDYETEVRTKEGDGRYVVLCERDGHDCKFITNSDEMKQMLDKVAQIADGFPFQTIIKRVAFGNNKYKYSFT